VLVTKKEAALFVLRASSAKRSADGGAGNEEGRKQREMKGISSMWDFSTQVETVNC